MHNTINCNTCLRYTFSKTEFLENRLEWLLQTKTPHARKAVTIIHILKWRTNMSNRLTPKGNYK